MYTCKCFIRRSTKELTNELKKFGSRHGRMLWYLPNTLLVADASQYWCTDDERGHAEDLVKQGYIDCGENEELFLALAALRNDTDKNQWITDIPGHWEKCTFDDGQKFIFFSYSLSNVNAHKATWKELLKHFKKE